MASKKEEIIDYFKNLDRSYFMEDSNKVYAKIDAPFPIGCGQTISQPSLVLKMTLLLDIKKDSKVLEIGTGSGYQTALLSEFAKEIYTVERIKDLYEKAKDRLVKAGYTNIKFKLDDGSIGWQENSPYDRIIVTASSSEIPNELMEQLAPEGIMIIPVGPNFVQDLMLLRKDSKGDIHEEIIEKVRFVRLRGKYE